MDRHGWRVVLIGLWFAASAVGSAQELRGFWVDTWHEALRAPAEVDALIQRARTAKANTLFVEVRKRGDAYYRSHYEPLASDISPGFDPLAYLIQRARQENPRLEVHAWLVMLPVWNSTTPPSNPAHPYNRFPQWLTLNDSGSSFDGSNFSFDPGHPDAADYIYRVASRYQWYAETNLAFSVLADQPGASTVNPYSVDFDIPG
ncbi:MAG: hypothetical protein C4335_14620, partial [Armatimonadota bacterium]